MRRLNYPELITESLETLQQVEKQKRGSKVEPRAQLLRLLKSGEVVDLVQGARVVGFSQRQVRRWWAEYQEGGLEQMLTCQSPPGRRSWLTAEARAGLEQEMQAGRIARLKDAQEYLRERWQIEYRSVQGISSLFRRHKIKKKTGRRQHRQTDREVQEAFKKGG